MTSKCFLKMINAFEVCRLLRYAIPVCCAVGAAPKLPLRRRAATPIYRCAFFKMIAFDAYPLLLYAIPIIRGGSAAFAPPLLRSAAAPIRPYACALAHPGIIT